MNNTPSHSPSLVEINERRLFLASCFALIATSVCFGVVGASLNALKAEFLLTNAQVGLIGGAALWGFTLSIILVGPFVELLGMKNLLRMAFLCHVIGALVMIFGGGFWMLFAGALIMAFANGTVEAVCNPLVATIYPEQKTKKLNQFHVWFPGGIALGGLGAFLLDQVGVTDWRFKIGLVLIPALIYAFLMLGQKFPPTERKASGVTFGGMTAAAFARPLFWVLLLSMAITASLELGPNRWIPPVLEHGGIPGILVLVYISTLMAVLRYFAGPVVERFHPTGVIILSAIVGGLGLYLFSFSQSTLTAFLAATIFAVGVCYFWPTMLGLTSERVPRSGELGLALMGGIGMAVVGLVTIPQMGAIADKYLGRVLDEEKTVAVLMEVVEEYPELAADAPEDRREETAKAVAMAAKVISDYEATGELPSEGNQTATALRSALSYAPIGAAPIVAEVNAVLAPADNYGGRMAFRYVAPLSGVIVVIFGILFLVDRKRGGYRLEELAQNKSVSKSK